MAGTETKRIIELTEASTVQSGDFIAVDSNARGTKKVSTDALATSAALTAETNARTGADEQMSERMDGIEEQTALIQNPTKTVSGSLVSFTDGADMPMVACTAEIVPKQSGTGTPSPDNVRPISGWESVSVTDAGKNLFDQDAILGGLGFVHEADGAWYVASPSSVSSGTVLWENEAEFAGQITLRCIRKTINTEGSQGGRFKWLYTDGTSTVIYMNNTTTYVDVTNTSSGGKVVESLLWDYGSGANSTWFKDVQVEEGSTATAYEPYNGTTTTTSLGRTVYGGTLDVVSGELSVMYALIDLGSLTWHTYNDKFDCVELPFEPLRKAYGTSCPMVCSIYKTGTFGNSAPQGDKTIWLSDSESWVTLWVEDKDYTTPAEFKTAMDGVQLCYKLATPQTHTLTPTEVKTLLGNNNVWADSGDVEITYRRDISIVLENLENALSGSNSLNTMMMSAPTENTAEEPTEGEAEDDMR